MTAGMNGNSSSHYNASPPPPPVPSAMPNSNNLHNSAVLERVLFQLHLRTCRIGLGLSASTRRLLEHFFLIVAIAGFGALILLHRVFVLRQGTLNCASTCLPSLPNWDPSADLYQVHILSEPTMTTSSSFVCMDESLSSLQGKENRIHMQVGDSRSIPSCTSFLEDLNIKSLPPTVYSFSNTQAFLLLPTNHSWIDSLRIHHVVLSPQDPYCFGEPFLQSLVRHFVGYDTVIVNSFLAHLRQQQKQQVTNSTFAPPVNPGVGYMRYARTGKVQEVRLMPNLMLPSRTDLNPEGRVHQDSHRQASSVSEKLFAALATANTTIQSMQAPGWSKVTVVFQTTMLFFFCTTLVSFTLRETQERMLEFTQELSRRVSINMPRVDLVLHHVIHNIVFVPIMVGMMFFLIEFYNGDRFLAFVIMSMFWCVEVYSVVSLRSYQGIAFFPPMFFLLFCLFHIYYFANPYGFVYVALLVMGCTMSHSVVFFWHRYELPAVALGRVTVDHPRNLHFETHHVNGSGTHPMPMPVTSDGTIQGSSPLGEHPNLTDRSYSPLATPAAPDPPSPPAIRLAHPPPSILEPTPPTSNLPSSRPNGSLQVPVVRRSSSSNLNMSNSTNSSRRTSVLQFLGSGAPVDDDDDESYVYFMGGEVVLHPRPERLDPLPMGQTDISHQDGTLDSSNGGEDDAPNQESNPLL